MSRHRQRAGLALSCACAFAQTGGAKILAPNSHLTAEGIPPISLELVERGDSEAGQLYRLDLDSRKVTLLTDPAEKHEPGPWNHAKNRLMIYSTQLDMTAGTERRKEVTTDVAILDPLHPETKRKVASLPGGGWGEFQWSPNDRQLLAVNILSANESTIWLIDLANGEKRQNSAGRGQRLRRASILQQYKFHQGRQEHIDEHRSRRRIPPIDQDQFGHAEIDTAIQTHPLGYRRISTRSNPPNTRGKSPPCAPITAPISAISSSSKNNARAMPSRACAGCCKT